MSAARVDVDWDTQHGAPASVFEAEQKDFLPLTSRIGVSRQPARCPECQSLVYSRRHRLCGVCNQPLPSELLFSAVEARRVEQLLRAEQNRHRRWMEQRQEQAW